MKQLETKTPLKLTTKYGGNTPCNLFAGEYHEGKALALVLIDPDTLPLATITCNIPNAPLAVDEILVKDWSENEGMAKWLEENEIAVATNRAVRTGFTSAPIMRLTESIFLQIFETE